MQAAVRACRPGVHRCFDAGERHLESVTVHSSAGLCKRSPTLAEEMLADRDARIDRPLIASEAVRTRLGHLAQQTAQETQLLGFELATGHAESGVVVVLDPRGQFAVAQAAYTLCQRASSFDVPMNSGTDSAIKSGGHREGSQASWRKRSSRQTGKTAPSASPQKNCHDPEAATHECG